MTGLLKIIRWLLSVLLFTGGLSPAMAQGQPALVRVVDATDGSPVSFANVCFEGFGKTFMQYVVTNDKGEASCNIPGRAIVAISYVGYETVYDSITPGETRLLKLNPSYTKMEEVVVTAQFMPRRADKSIYKVKVINSKQIEMKAATNLSDLLRSEVSIRTNQDAVLGSDISLQGLSGENVKFLIDGIPVIGRMNGNIDLSQINLNNADHIEIIEGPMSVVYGSNAIAGVVNIITRENQHDKLMVRANGYTESVGVFNADGAFSVKSGSHLFMFSGGRNFFGGYSDPDTSRAKLWKPKRQVFADGSWLYTKNNLRIKIGGQFFDELLLFKENLLAPYFETAFESEFYTRRYVARGDLSWKISENQSISALAAWSGFNRRKEKWFKDLTTLNRILTSNIEDQDTSTFNSYNFRGQWSRFSDDHWLNWQAGFDFNIEQGTGKRIDGGSQQMGDYAAFASLLLRPHPIIEIQPGVRSAYNSRYSAPIVYSLNVKWNINEWFSLRGSAAKGFRAPVLKELYMDFVDVNHDIHGNPLLKAENSDNFNMVLQFQRDRSRYQVTTGLSVFYNHVSNIITLAEQEKQSYNYVNVDNYRSQGGQLHSTFRFYPRLVISAGVGVTGTSSSVDGDNIAWTTDFSSEVTYHWLHRDVSMTVWYKYTGRLPKFYTDQTGALYETIIEDYHMLDVSVNKGFWNNQLNVGIGVKNLFDVTSIDSGGSSSGIHSGGGSTQPVGWGRSYFVKVSYQFSKKN
ncbi:MAG TPA: hypothetical protein DCR43_07130 [Bacteroidales bacterium]|nr:hypothetical protein [Bacteroidales bacterium]HBZ66912.1 hypothetical protein [Bacteroidales bacterium]